ncbi:fungal specific transcription factor domain-containing protein [Colletotrichum graminicola]|uniref:Fungal specific transcription factor domain-containing protein n=1 Tax=Colletotrichum graminicola (strain M1.001 / M2 / FGSC 10212) TaxID=645133 RepID=E3QSH4_COLGM|nr:fungal specific transcription factor domain-containing protein [Colletotrichum graminicola M1.001]EFQ33801.1 fungal specific transcription factor domain-containing protein [Colletotrichum graminicola M1.001]WDK21076.1 fungal specific transcription factor domain-containing protein [Colletotrichum graminicola]
MDVSEVRRPVTYHARHSSSTASAASPRGESRKRRFSSADLQSPDSDELTGPSANRRKLHKVSRACDFCKQRKAKCSGTIPCDKCTRKGRTCVYDAKYSRGRPPTPPPSSAVWSTGSNTGASHRGSVSVAGQEESAVLYQTTETAERNAIPPSSQLLLSQVRDRQGPASRASPELGMAEIQGQIFDPTSGVTFLHRAWKRLSRRDSSIVSAELNASTESQPLMLAGDKPLPSITDEDMASLTLPDSKELQTLLGLYFDVCIATYRVLHRPSVEAWLGVMVDNLRRGKPVWQEIGRSKASIVLTALAVSAAHQEKSNGLNSQENETMSLAKSDRLFCVALQLSERETGLPRLESAQSRLIQVLYLLTTSRMNRAWYTFGNALQIISALGMHRKTAKKRHLTAGSADFIQAQCRMRTFWTAYVLDKYLGVILGRPRHFHDDDIDQEYPDRIEDEDMTAQGPVERSEEHPDCHIEALIFHVKIARIIGNTSREVYSIKPISERERVAAAHRLSEEIHDWRASLPPHLGSIRPSMLIPSFRRQATVLRLAYSHAIMHANRLFLLGNLSSGSEAQVIECIEAARTVLETVDGMAAEGPIFHAFWWTQYVTFCALLVTYVRDIQQKRRGLPVQGAGRERHAKLMDLAERCQTHLAHATASNSPSRRYAIVLEEFRTEGLGHVARKSQAPAAQPQLPPQQAPPSRQQSHENQRVLTMAAADGLGFDPAYAADGSGPAELMGQGDSGLSGFSLLDEWQTTDWLELDSSAFGPYMDTDADPLAWMPDLGG